MKKTIIIVAIVIAILLGAGYFAKKQMDKAMKYCYNYNIKKSKVGKVSATSLVIDFAIDFKNSSDITATLDGYKFEVIINNIKVGEVSSTKGFYLTANTITTIVVPINVNPSALLSKKLINADTIKNIISDKSKVNLTIKGSVTGGAIGLQIKDMPIEFSMSLAEIMAPTTEPKTECK